MMQALRGDFGQLGIASGGDMTYKPAHTKIPVRTPFCEVVVRNFQRRGMGSPTIKKSRAQLIALVARSRVSVSTHLPGVPGSQNRCIGWL